MNTLPSKETALSVGLKISLSVLGGCGIALSAWMLLGYTANFQRTPDLVGSVTLFMIALPLLLLSIFAFITAFHPNMQRLLPLKWLLLAVTGVMLITAWNDARTITPSGWLTENVKSDTLKITEDDRYMYQMEVVNRYQRNDYARLFIEKRQSGLEQRIPLELSTAEINDIVLSGSDWGKMTAQQGDYIFMLSPTDAVSEATWRFEVDLEDWEAKRLQTANRDRTSSSADQLLTQTEQNALATPDHPVDSPGGTFRVTIKKIDASGVERLEVMVTDLKKGESVVVEDQLRTRDSNFVLWDDRERLWIYSGDTGVTVWIYESGHWESNDYSAGNLVLPNILAKLRPALINKNNE